MNIRLNVLSLTSSVVLILSGCNESATSSVPDSVTDKTTCDTGTIWSELTQQCEIALCEATTIDESPNNCDVTPPPSEIPLSEMNAPALVAEYYSTLEDIYPECTAYTESLLPNGLTIDSGNANWFSKLSTSNIFNNVPALIGESGYVYAYQGQKQASRYFVSGINIWRSKTSPEVSDHVLVQEQVLNHLLQVDNYQDENLKVWSEDSDFNNHPIADYVTLISSSGKDAGIENADVDLFIGKSTSIELMEKVLAKGTPIIIAYNHNGWVDNSTASLFDVSVSKGKLESLVSGLEPCDKLTEEYQNTAIMLEHLVNNSFAINSSTMPPNTVDGDKVNFEEIADPSSGKNLEDVYQDPIDNLRSSIKFYDNQGINILTQDHLKHLQIPIYLGDLYRNSLEYNGYEFYADIYGSADDVDYNQWFKTFFTDLTTHFARPDNKRNFDLGDFSPRESEIQQLPTFTANFDYELTPSSHVTAVGVYVKAGQPTVVKRTDSNPNDLLLYVNYQRDGATKLFHEKGRSYSRPALDRSHGVRLAVGGQVTLSSPIGGPLFVSVPNNEDSDSISFRISNVLKNPVISGVSDSDIQNFEDTLADSPFNWVTVITKEVQLHSIASKFAESMSDYGYDVKKFIEDIVTYTLGNFGYAGYLSDTLPDHSDSIKQFCSDLGITDLCADRSIHRRKSVQHVYVDRAACGSLCSGNPYDRSTAYIPGDWGDSHEIGHNLQENRLKIYSSRSTEVSNNIFPVESRRLKAIELGEDTYDVRSNFADTFELMKAGIGLLNKDEHPLWSGTDTYSKAFERLGFYNQLLFASGDTEFYTKMYLLQRIAENRDNDDSDWDNYKAQLGFSHYSRDEFQNVNGNDFMAISASLLMNKDVSQFFEGFGIAVSDAAKAQIASQAYLKSISMGIYYVDNEHVPVDLMPGDKEQYFINLTPDATYADPTK